MPTAIETMIEILEEAEKFDWPTPLTSKTLKAHYENRSGKMISEGTARKAIAQYERQRPELVTVIEISDILLESYLTELVEVNSFADKVGSYANLASLVSLIQRMGTDRVYYVIDVLQSLKNKEQDK